VEMSEGRSRDWSRAVRNIAAVLLLLIGTLVAVLGVQKPARAQDVTEEDAAIRVVHASPGAPNVDVLVDGQPLVQDLAFGAATEYVGIRGGDHKVQVVPTGQGADAALIDTDLNVDGGDAYVFVAMDRLNDIEGKVFEVNLDQVDAGKARVRLINASPDAGGIDLVETGGDEIFGGVDFKDATDYTDLDARSYSFDIRGDNDRMLLTGQQLALTDGDVYDIVALGQLADNSLALLPLVTKVSVPCAQVLGIQGGEDDACVRIVHTAPGTADVDVYVNDSPIVQGLKFGTASEFVAVPGGDNRKIQVTAAGGTPGDGDLFDAEIDFDGRDAYDVFITGNPDDLKATSAKLDLSALAGGQARVRAVHTSPDAEGVDVVIAEGPKLFDGVDFRDVTDTKTIDAGTYTLQVKKGDTVAIAGDVTFDPSTVYDVVIVGRTDDNTLALLILTAPTVVREGGVATPVAEESPNAGTAEATMVQSTAEGEGTVVPTAGAVDLTPTPTT
jgi:hypothetical protein